MNIGARTDLTHEFYFIYKKVKVRKGKNKLPGVTSKLISVKTRIQVYCSSPSNSFLQRKLFSYVLPM